ncbi:hypothetical protein K7X08_026926 [Anisodus acutangulus]|uniref:Uncharacterized protein n=1 Tax=Anisodus acutangulus TaxID=402998 RepID=A0A9Q1QZM3_9SOLA|nr:hypothetical protein K7X08_026926 [Anisodus acutangulus]
MSFAGHRRRLWKLNGGEAVPFFEVFAETQKKKKKKNGTREGWVEPRAKETYEGFHKSLEDWRQTQPASEDGTAVRPSPADITSIWTEVAGGPSKDQYHAAHKGPPLFQEETPTLPLTGFDPWSLIPNIPLKPIELPKRTGVLHSSSRPSPLLSNAFTSQNTKEMEAMRRQIAELKQKCETSDAKLAKIEKFMMKHMPQGSDDEEETESDDN